MTTAVVWYAAVSAALVALFPWPPWLSRKWLSAPLPEADVAGRGPEPGRARLWATSTSSALFGLWHVLPALDLSRTNTALRPGPGSGGRRVLLTVLGTVAFTTAAGVVFAELYRRSGSLLAPIGLHWATNGLGVLASARVWAISRP